MGLGLGLKVELWRSWGADWGLLDVHDKVSMSRGSGSWDEGWRIGGSNWCLVGMCHNLQDISK
jgi:hypothetical protein